MSKEQNLSDIVPDSDSDSEEFESTPSSNCGDGVVKQMSLRSLFALAHTGRRVDHPAIIEVVEE